MLAACSLSTQGSDYEPSGTSRAGSGGSGGVDAPSGGTGGGGAGGSVAMGPEKCSDGADNDGNGAVDCADTDVCGALVECVPSAPTDWTTYARFSREQFPGSGPPGKCADGSDPEVFYAGPAGGAACSACSCAWPGATCTAPEISCWKGTKNCVGESSFTTEAASSDCLELSNFVSTEDASCRLTGLPSVGNEGQCATVGGELGPAWDEVIYVCPAPPSPGEGGCGAGERCVPKGGGAFGGPACAAKPSAEGCPTGWTASEVKSYGGADDERACKPCKCATGVSCVGGSYLVRAYNDCTGSMSTVDSTTCVEVTGQLDDNAGSLKPTLPTVMDGTCGGGEPSGSLNPKDPLTICCPDASP